MKIPSKKKIFSIFGLLLLLASLPITIKLAQNPQILMSLASNDPITFYNPDGAAITESEVYAEQNLPVVHGLTVRVELTAPDSQSASIPGYNLVSKVYAAEGDYCSNSTTPGCYNCYSAERNHYSRCDPQPAVPFVPAEPAADTQTIKTAPTGPGCIESRFSCQCESGMWGSRPYNSCQGGDGYTGPCECAPAAPPAQRPAVDSSLRRQEYEFQGQKCVRTLVPGSCYETTVGCGGNLCTQKRRFCTYTDTCNPESSEYAGVDPEYQEQCICGGGQQYQPRCGNGICDMNEYSGNCFEDCQPRNEGERAVAEVARASRLTAEQRDPNKVSRSEADRQAFRALSEQAQEVLYCTLGRLAEGNLIPCTPAGRQGTQSVQTIAQATRFIVTDSPNNPSDPSEADPNAVVGTLNSGVGATTYTFSNNQEGPKTLFVKFLYSNATSMVRLKTVIYRPQNAAAATPTPAPTPGSTASPSPDPAIETGPLLTRGFPTPTPSPSPTKVKPNLSALLTCEGIRRPAVNGLLEARVVGTDKLAISQVVTFRADGTIQNPPELDIGKDYILTIKPNLSLRKAIQFSASVFNQNLGELTFDMGDIIPQPTDNIINSLDLLKLQEEAANPSQVLTSDFNLDGTINSIDYTCLNSNMNKKGD